MLLTSLGTSNALADETRTSMFQIGGPEVEFNNTFITDEVREFNRYKRNIKANIDDIKIKIGYERAAKDDIYKAAINLKPFGIVANLNYNGETKITKRDFDVMYSTEQLKFSAHILDNSDTSTQLTNIGLGYRVQEHNIGFKLDKGLENNSAFHINKLGLNYSYNIGEGSFGFEMERPIGSIISETKYSTPLTYSFGSISISARATLTKIPENKNLKEFTLGLSGSF